MSDKPPRNTAGETPRPAGIAAPPANPPPPNVPPPGSDAGGQDDAAPKRKRVLVSNPEMAALAEVSEILSGLPIRSQARILSFLNQQVNEQVQAGAAAS